MPIYQPPPKVVFTTGFPEVDALTGIAGLPSGSITEFYSTNPSVLDVVQRYVAATTGAPVVEDDGTLGPTLAALGGPKGRLVVIRLPDHHDVPVHRVTRGVREVSVQAARCAVAFFSVRAALPPSRVGRHGPVQITNALKHYSTLRIEVSECSRHGESWLRFRVTKNHFGPVFHTTEVPVPTVENEP